MDELRKHIRNGMLTLNLIIASFLIVANLPVQTVYQRAIDEARAIRVITDRWSAFQTEGLLRKYIEQDSSRMDKLTTDEMVINAKVERPASDAQDYPAANSGNDLVFAFRPDPTLDVSVNGRGKIPAAPILVANARNGRDFGLPRGVGTIGEFKALWNGLPEASKLLWVNGFSDAVQANILFRGRTTNVAELQGVSVSFSRATEEYSPSGVRFLNKDKTYQGRFVYQLLDQASSNVQKLSSGKVPVLELTQKNGAVTNAYIYLGINFEELHFQTLLSEGLPIPPGTFNASFENVKDVIGEFDGFRIADLDAFISLMSRLTAEQAKLFGLNVPQTIVFSWGCVISAQCARENSLLVSRWRFAAPATDGFADCRQNFL